MTLHNLHLFINTYLVYFRNELENLEGEREEVLKDLRLIESRSNQVKDERNIEGLTDLGSSTCKTLQCFIF